MTGPTFVFLVIAEDGVSHEHRHRMTDRDTIDEIVRAALGGWLEHIPVTDPTLTLWCHEEGHLRGRAVNPVGSRLAALLGGGPAVYAGPIVVTGNHRHTTVSLTEQQIEHLLAALRLCQG